MTIHEKIISDQSEREIRKEVKQALVTVIIPTFNRAWSLDKTVQSVFKQTYRPLECIVVDDGSTDETEEVVRELSRSIPDGIELCYFKKPNGGPNTARNLGMIESHGEFICFLDSDDIIPPESIARRVGLLLDNPDSDFCYGRCAVLDETGRQLRTLNEPWPSETEARISRYLFISNSPLIRRSLCFAAGFWREDDRHGQEYEYFARLKFYCKRAIFTYEILSFYIKHNRDHIFDSSLEFNHATYRVLCSVQSLLLFSPKDSPPERQALSLEFTKLGDRLSEQGDHYNATMAWMNAFWLAPRLKGFLRCALGTSYLFIDSAWHLLTDRFNKKSSDSKSCVTVNPAQIQSRGLTTNLSSAGSLNRINLNRSETEPILAWWTGGYNNWGDIVTPFLLNALTGREVKRGHGPGCIYAIGSIISNIRNGGYLWGCGLLSRHHIPVPFPEDVIVHAVRGPLTRKALSAIGVTVPEVYGDPVLLMPYLYFSKKLPRTKVGIICHYNDSSYLGDISGTRSYRIIDIQAGFRAVLEAVLDCESVISSSLHGLVLAEAYGKITAWLQLDKGKHLAGRKFKFQDYFLSTQRRPCCNRLRAKQRLDFNRIKWLESPKIDLQPLLSAFPGIPDLTLSKLRPISIEKL